MTTSIAMSHDDTIPEIIKLINKAPNRLAAIHLLRASRTKLGCALEQLESIEPAQQHLEQLLDHAASIACEIDVLLRSIQQFVGRGPGSKP